MISKTRQDMSDNALHFLVWGWITFFACTGQFVLKHVLQVEKHYLVWLLVVPGILFSNIYGRRQERHQRVLTYVGESMKYLWIGMAISYFVLSLILSQIGWGFTVFPFFILLYGLGSFVSGCFLQFRPLWLGGIGAWCLAIGAAFMEYDYQMLFAAAAILVSYIIPAYLLRGRKNTFNQH